jgi:DnaK suppressor protein
MSTAPQDQTTIDPEAARERLQAKLAQVQAELQALAAADQGARLANAQMQYGKRIGDHTTDAVVHRTTVGAAEALERLQTDVLAALELLKTGEYGRCRDCHRPIVIARLQALPWASRCMECQTKIEHRHRP